MKKYLRDMNTQELETVLKNNEFLQHEITKMNEYDCELLARDGQEELAKKLLDLDFQAMLEMLEESSISVFSNYYVFDETNIIKKDEAIRK